LDATWHAQAPKRRAVQRRRRQPKRMLFDAAHAQPTSS